MEVEVKLRLPSADAHGRIATLLADLRKETNMQENVFFDGTKGELSSKRAVLRLRFVNDNAKCEVTVKSKAVVANGISQAQEENDQIDPALGRACVIDPNRLTTTDCALLNKTVEAFQCKEFTCLGGFKNIRTVFEWEGLTLELDETQYDFGTFYELECESTEPEVAREKIEGFLEANGIAYSYSTETKFAIFIQSKMKKSRQ
ncbi:hypothetical protein CBR_g17084 [Chara braunii]|uniref:CYTH domain-containing protein n=1 Tax=Chara braunii TaxID=69332 RepID=A0A388KUK0_CHABU|nr:hypothetical protein CBR_g17084 [Chara braunii]|eukprot:GBG73744.1 hypothetical protein CBR_g17084 [Chara braunii]